MALTVQGGGINLTCPDLKQFGGVKKLFLANQEDIVSWSPDSTNTHEYTNIVFASTGVGFEQIEFKPGECSLKQAEAKVDSGALVNSISIEFAEPKLWTSNLKKLVDIANNCKLVAVCELYSDSTNKFLVAGFDEVFTDESFLEVTKSDFDSGKKKEDNNGFVITLEGKMGEKCRQLTGISGATTPAVTVVEIETELVAATSI